MGSKSKVFVLVLIVLCNFIIHPFISKPHPQLYRPVVDLSITYVVDLPITCVSWSAQKEAPCLAGPRKKPPVPSWAQKEATRAVLCSKDGEDAHAMKRCQVVCE